MLEAWSRVLANDEIDWLRDIIVKDGKIIGHGHNAREEFATKQSYMLVLAIEASIKSWLVELTL